MGKIADIVSRWTPLINLIKNKDFLTETFDLIPVEVIGSMCDNMLGNRSTLLETLLLNDRMPDCSALLLVERENVNHTGILDTGRGRAFYEKLRQVQPAHWDLNMLRFSPEALDPSDI